MSKKHVIDGSDNATATFVVTPGDIDRLRSELEMLGDEGGLLAYLTSPEVFFKFDNYPEFIFFSSVKDARHTLERASNFYANYPQLKYWISIGKAKEHD